jgi:hypothetical protein
MNTAVSTPPLDDRFAKRSFTAPNSYSEERPSPMDDLAMRGEQVVKVTSMAVRSDEVSLQPVILKQQYGRPSPALMHIMFDDEQM